MRHLVTAIASQLKELSEFYDRLTLRQQATAMLNIMLSPSYDHKKMLNKFRQHAHRINEQKTVTDYAREFEKVYNFKSKLGETRLF
jgi:acetylornithine deacetylase/succinyl-diaminopimelate desuccinylase-like protein